LFRAPDNPNAAEGIAGRTWAIGKIVLVDNLPDLSVNSSQKPADLELYAEKTGVKVAWLKEALRKQQFLARSFCGIPVEVKGRLWGVIVVDSRRPKIVAAEETYRLVSRVLGKLLERA